MNDSFWNKKIKLKNLSFPFFMAAPMDGITDSPMRRMIRKFSKDELLFTEMRHVSCVANERSERSLQYNKIEEPLAFQVSANTTEFIDKAVSKICSKKFCMLNLNAACPAKGVVKSGSGSALMADLDRLKEILIALKKELKDKIPLTIKIRAGFKKTNALDVSFLAQDCGCEMIIIHPRLQTGGFSSKLDFDLVKEIKEKVKIPVVFSGNVNSAKRAKMTYEKTGVDGLMIGRPLWGVPWKIKEIISGLEGKEFSISNEEAVKLAIEHLDWNIEFYGDKGFSAFKKHAPQYIKNIEDAARIRKELVTSQSYEEMRAKLERLI